MVFSYWSHSYGYVFKDRLRVVLYVTMISSKLDSLTIWPACAQHIIVS